MAGTYQRMLQIPHHVVHWAALLARQKPQRPAIVGMWFHAD